METKELTLGEKRVRVNFNVTGDSQIDTVKKDTAELINLLDRIKNDEVSKTYDKPNAESQLQATSGEKLRLIALAQTTYEEAAMWAVKAITAE